MAQSDGVSRSYSAGMKTKLSSFLTEEKKQPGWLEENKSLLLTGGGICLVLLVCAVTVLIYRHYKASSFHEELRSGIAAFQEGKLDDAIFHLEKVSRQASNDDEAKIARFYLTEAYSRSEKYDEAKKAAALNPPSLSSDSTYLSQLLLLSEGRTAEKQNDLSAARKVYEKAADIEGPFTLDSLWALARVAESAGDGTAATSAREKILANYPNAPLAEVVRQKLGK